MDPEQARRVEDLVTDVAPAARQPTTLECPPDDLLVGLVQQQLPEGVSETIRAHLADCEDCRQMAALLADEPLVAEDRPTTRHRTSGLLGRPVLLLAMAACLVVGLGLLLLWQDTGGEASTDTRLVAAVQTLRAADPEHFAGFRALGADERLAPYEPEVKRGALRLEVPRRTLLTNRPTFRWGSVAGASAYEVVVYDAEGSEVWRRSLAGTELPYPADEDALRPGTQYLWRVDADGAMGSVSGRAAFELADEAETIRFAKARQQLAETSPADLVPLLEAHLAIRHDYLVHAWQVLAEASPDDAVVRETRRYVAVRLDLPADG